MTEFIFMLTRDDVTVSDARAKYADVRGSGLRWVGFKDLGLPFDELRAIADEIHHDDRKVALEVVSLDKASELRSAEAALEIGVDLLMGGVHPEAVRPLVAATNLLYFPFPGRVTGHPSVLEGTVEDIAESARRLTAMRGVHGLDLLAYRFSGDVPRLMSAVVGASFGPVVVAGSVDSDARIEAVKQSGAWAFTVGSAVIDGAFRAASTTAGQVDHILDLISTTSPAPRQGAPVDGPTAAAATQAPSEA